MYRRPNDAVSDLRDRGFNEFEFSGNDLSQTTEKMLLMHGDFVIVESHRFCRPAGSNADIIIHGVVLKGSPVKGILISQCSEVQAPAAGRRTHSFFKIRIPDLYKYR